MFLERHFIIKDLPNPLTIRTALKKWYLPRKWQHELRSQRRILINHQYRPFKTLLDNGDQVDLSLDLNYKNQNYLAAAQCDFSVCYENSDLLVIDKPAGIKTHPNQPQENDTLFNQVRTYLGFNPLMIHRLDKMTSGLIMIGKNPLIIPIMNRQLSQKIMSRNYLAVTQYNPQAASVGSIKRPLGHDLLDPRKRQINSQGLFAWTDYRIIQHNQKYALLHLQLHTGRTHQIRVHLQSIGMPILGDPLYGTTSKRMYLHAYQLKYQRPFSQDFQTVTISIPADFYQLTS